MPVTLKFDPNSTVTQAAVIQDASIKQDGVMTRVQAAQLATLVAGGGGGGGGGTSFTIPPTKVNGNTYAAVAGDYIRVSAFTGPGQIALELPNAATCSGKSVNIKDIGTESNSAAFIDLTSAGGLIEGAVSLNLGTVNPIANNSRWSIIFTSDGTDWWISWIYLGVNNG